MIDRVESEWECERVGGELTAVVNEENACAEGTLLAKHDVKIAAKL